MAELREDVQHTFDAVHTLIDTAQARSAPNSVEQDLCLALSELTSIVGYMAHIQSHPSPLFTRGNDRFVAGVAIVLCLGMIFMVAREFWR